LSFRPILWFAVAALVALGGGWIWGAAGKAAVMAERRALTDRAELAEVRGLALGGRVSLFALNFGDAARQFGEAHRALVPIQTRLRQTSQAERAGRLEIILADLRDAERLATALDSNAHAAATRAADALAAFGRQ
jgi:hypothetical protein